MTSARAKKKQPFEPGLVPAPGALLEWRDGQHFDRWQDRPCALCESKSTKRATHA
ncbi:hypothetical protein ACODT4_44065 [Streptomyces sp. 2.9]|uniref:hypothetical protein n=1 Tax=Streptomyces tritrimontium TaxID=3406573 RepID=UPI003BB61983